MARRNRPRHKARATTPAQRTRPEKTAGVKAKRQARPITATEHRTIIIALFIIAAIVLALAGVEGTGPWNFLTTAIGVAMGLQKTGW